MGDSRFSDDDVARIDRRTFLKSAALGVTAAAILGPSAMAADGSSASVDDPIDTFEGILAGASPEQMEVTLNGEMRVVPIDVSATFWKGGEVPLLGFKPGDAVLVRTIDGLLQRAWSNLGVFRGYVVAKAEGGYEVAPSLGQPSTQTLYVSDSTEWANPLTGDSAAPADLPVGTEIDVTGLLVTGGLRATLLGYVLPGSVLPPLEPEVVFAEVSGFPPVCYVTYRGIASKYSCPNGAGKCTTCNTSDNSQIAYPHVENCDRATGCKNQRKKSCGSLVSLENRCTNRSKNVAIVDCGPCNNGGGGCSPITCSHTCNLCGGRTTPVVDCTLPTFAWFEDPTRGCFEANVTVPYAC